MADFDSMIADSPNAAAPTQSPVASQTAAASSFDSMKDDSETYGGIGSTIAAGAEGALRGIAGPLAPMAEKLAGVSYKSQRAREAVHPVAGGVGEAGGLLGGLLTGTGEAALMTKAGKAVEIASGLTHAADASLIAKIGSSAVRNAAEMAILQGTDNVTKHVMQDPNAAAESAIANVGLAAAIGAGGGALGEGVISPLWKATIGPKLESALSGLTSKLGGVEGKQVANKAADLEAKLGVPIPNELKAVVNDVPGARMSNSMLSQNDHTMAGRAYQKTRNAFEDQVGGKIVEALGRPASELSNIPEKNNFVSGQNMADSLHDELKPIVNDINNRYEATTEKFKGAPVGDALHRSMSQEISQLALDKGWQKAFDTENMDLVNNVLKKLPEQSTVNDLKNAITNFSRSWDAKDYVAAKEVKKVLSRGLEEAVGQHIAPEEVAAYSKLRSDYAGLSNHLEDLDTHLHVGKWGGPSTFLAALKERGAQKGEQFLNNMTGKNNAALLDLLKAHPETLGLVKNHYVDGLLREATAKLPPGDVIDTGKLLNNIEKMSPQVKGLIASPEQHDIIKAASDGLAAFRDPTHNWSNTARTSAKNEHWSLSPISTIAAIMGHGGAGVLSFLGKVGFDEARPAVKLGMLKFLGSDAPISAPGFKAMVNMIDHAHGGGNALTKGVKAVFQPGMRVLTDHQMPSAKDLEKLDKLVAKHTGDAHDALQDTKNQHTGYYLGQHQVALSQTQANAVRYLDSIKPKPVKNSPLDKPMEPTPMAKARYERALSIAQNPLVVLQHVKDGTLQQSDLQDYTALYPNHANLVSQAVTNEMIDHKSADQPIPYKTMVSVSLLLGQSLDTSTKPASIQAAQAVFAPKPPPQTQQGGMKPKSPNKQTMGKSNNQYKTPSQSAESDRANRD